MIDAQINDPPAGKVAAAPAKRSARYLAALLMSGALLSKALGFVRELIMAQVLGASLVADGFRGAMAAILLPLAFLQNESVPAILIPMQQDAHKRDEGARHLAAMTIAITLTALVLMLLVQALGAWWVKAVVGGFVPEGQALTLEFVRVMALGMPASAALNCLSAGEIAIGQSRLTNLRAIVLNVAVISGLGVLAMTGRVGMLAWAFTIAFNGLTVWAVWSLLREGRIRFDGLTSVMVFEAGYDFIKRLRPLLALPLSEQANIWVERALASRIATGAVASLEYARTLTESALLLISQPVGLAVLSNYSPQDSRNQIESILRPVLAVGLPTSVFLFVFAPDIVRLVFMRGAFSEAGVLMTSQALRGIAVGLWASTLGWILLRMLNGASRNGVAALILVTAYVANIGVNVLTSSLQKSSGLLLLGLGESVRGFVMLGGIALALECGRRVGALTLLAAAPALLMALAGWQIQGLVGGYIERLLAGGLAFGVCIGLAAVMLMPSSCHAALVTVRSFFLRSEKS